jgi:hypothetical protein
MIPSNVICDDNFCHLAQSFVWPLSLLHVSSSEKQLWSPGKSKKPGQVIMQYLLLTWACSSIFSILEQLNLVNHFYQFSLRFFLYIFGYILRTWRTCLTCPEVEGPSNRFITGGIQTRLPRPPHFDHVMLATLLLQVNYVEKVLQMNLNSY